MASKVKMTFDDAAIRRAAREAAEKWSTGLSTKLNALSSEYEGRPVDEVREVVAHRWVAWTGKEFVEPLLSQYAQAISEGREITITTK